MPKRIRYAILLLLSLQGIYVSLLAIFVGLWPLSLAALIAIPLVGISTVGLLHPPWVENRRVLRRYAAFGGGAMVAETLILAAVMAWTQRRPVQLVLETPIPSRVRVIYGVSDGAPRSWLRWTRRFDVPPSGVIHTQYSADRGWYRENNRHPLQAIIDTGAGGLDTIPATWTRGGVAEGGACTFAYDEFVLRDTTRMIQPPIDASPPTDWLDSLPLWGVECQKGRLVRAPAGRSPSIRRTGTACYYDQHGGMTCSFETGPA